LRARPRSNCTFAEQLRRPSGAGDRLSDWFWRNFRALRDGTNGAIDLFVETRQRRRVSGQTVNAEGKMLYYAVVFFIIALIAALFGFGGIAAGAAGIAKILFVVFLIVSVVTFLLSLARR
jgi:uncharacterized membrane protein YtjA (UPF0391 family)